MSAIEGAPEQVLEAQLKRVPAWTGRNLNYSRIQGGITNLNWLVTLKDEGIRYFAKLPGAKTEIFIDRHLAHEAARKAADTGFAPGIIFIAPDGAIEVHEFLEGYRSCNVADLLNADVRANVARAYRAIHRTQQLSGVKTGFDQLRERLAQVRDHGGRLPRDLEQLLWQAKRVEEAVTAAGMDYCMCFNDAYVTNYMVDAQRNVKIIDWEYASNNDPYWDLGMFREETFLEGDALRQFIEAHDGTFTEAAEARVFLYGGVGMLLWSFWAALQARISTVPFDFAKYSELLALRARARMDSESWEEALLTV
ncbi:phosphotransferase [Bradyrhizobium sp.]|uniref:phosphotransferase n=1 Tax=Bradyrhizobium sp. TaxID=376 RepID=UPI0039E6F4DF